MTTWGNLAQYAQIAPLITATVAALALLVAAASLTAQKQIARRRAAIDFFLKTELDQNMLNAHGDFETAVKALKAHLSIGGTVKSFADDATQYKKIWSYLNVHELIAVGIKNKIFDEDICYHYWSDALIRHAKETAEVIRHEVETEEGSPAAFLELRLLQVRWLARTEKWNRKYRNKMRTRGQRRAF